MELKSMTLTTYLSRLNEQYSYAVHIGDWDTANDIAAYRRGAIALVEYAEVEGIALTDLPRIVEVEA